MARLRSSTFQGSTISEVDIDQLTLKRVVSHAIGDTALVADILTGDNSPPSDSTINHTGLDGSLYRGCPLGIPLAQVGWPANGGVGVGPSLDHADGIDVIIALIPFYLPRGEDSVSVVVTTGARVPVIAEIRTILGTLVVANALRRFDDTTPDVLSTFQTGLTGGVLYYLALRTRNAGGIGTPTHDIELTGIFVGFLRQTKAPLLTPSRLTGSPFSVPTATVSDGGGDAHVVSLTNFDAVLVADDRALSSFHVSRLNGNQNALDEFLTGAPCAGNEDYTLVDSDLGVSPTVSAFHDHSQAGRSNEELVDVPLWGEPWGGIQADGTSASFNATWEPPALIADATIDADFVEVLLYIPHAPAGGGSNLQVVLMGTVPNNGTLDCDATIECFDASDVGAGAATGTFAQATTPTRFWYCIINAVPFHPDVFNRLKITLTYGTGPGSLSAALHMLGGCAHLRV